MDQILKLNEFFVEGGHQETSHVLLHITEPSTPEEIQKGYFFAVCEINQATAAYITKLQSLIDEAENDYYEIPDEPNKNSLEIVLEHLNQKGANLRVDGVDLHCVIGAIRQPEIIFTFYGKPHMLLFYRNQQGYYQKMDLLANPETAEDAPSVFAHIIQGKISPHDFLFVGTPHVSSHFTYDRLEKLIPSRGALASAQHIERVLSEVKNGYSFGGLIIQSQKNEPKDKGFRKSPLVKGDSSQSLSRLFNTEKNTASTLAASFWPNINEKIQGYFKKETTPENRTTPTEKYQAAEINATRAYSPRPKSATLVKKIPKDKALHILAGVVRALKGLAVLIGWIAITFYSLLYSLLRTGALFIIALTNYQHRRKTIVEDWKRQWRSFKENLGNLPTITKLLLTGSLLVALLFVGSLSFIRYHKKQAAEMAAFNRTVEQIKVKKDLTESALIYRDEAAAFLNFKESEVLIASLRCVNANQKKICADFQTASRELSTKVRKATEVAPELLHESALPVNKLVKINNKLLAFSPSTSTLLSFDLVSKEGKLLPSFPTIPGFVDGSVPKENDFALLVSTKQELVSVKPEDNSVKILEKTAGDEANIKATTIYNRRLYTLDSEHSQIYRYDLVKTGVGPHSNWAKDSASVLAGGADITIDGDVFVLGNDGQITKFTGGAGTAFPVQGLDPALKNAGEIWSYVDLSYLYLLDPVGQRLLIIEKDGRLRQQLLFPRALHPTGFTLDSQNNTVYLVDNGKIYKLVLPQ